MTKRTISPTNLSKYGKTQDDEDYQEILVAAFKIEKKNKQQQDDIRKLRVSGKEI